MRTFRKRLSRLWRRPRGPAPDGAPPEYSSPARKSQKRGEAARRDGTGEAARCDGTGEAARRDGTQRAQAWSSGPASQTRRRRVRSGTQSGGGATGRETTSSSTSAAATAHTTSGSTRCCHSAHVASSQQPVMSAMSAAERRAGLASSADSSPVRRAHQRGWIGTSHSSTLAARIASAALRCQVAEQNAGTMIVARAAGVTAARLPLSCCRDWYGRSVLGTAPP